jgi:hypothetical protein
MGFSWREIIRSFFLISLRPAALPTESPHAHP